MFLFVKKTMFLLKIVSISFVISTINGYWQPTPLTNWTWQLTGNINMNKNVLMYDIDLWDTSINTIKALKNSGKIVICYFRLN